MNTKLNRVLLPSYNFKDNFKDIFFKDFFIIIFLAFFKVFIFPCNSVVTNLIFGLCELQSYHGSYFLSYNSNTWDAYDNFRGFIMLCLHINTMEIILP